LSSTVSAIEAESVVSSTLVTDDASLAESPGMLVMLLFPQALNIKAVLNASNSVFFLMIKLHFCLRFHFLRLLDKSSPASKVTGTASTEINAVAPAVRFLLVLGLSELFVLTFFPP
jgi:hypothetical protein